MFGNLIQALKSENDPTPCDKKKPWAYARVLWNYMKLINCVLVHCKFCEDADSVQPTAVSWMLTAHNQLQ